MDKDLFVKRMSELLKPVRAEYSLTQEEMAETLGISKTFRKEKKKIKVRRKKRVPHSKRSDASRRRAKLS